MISWQHGNSIVPARVAEFGRRTGLRIQRGNPWGFESPLSHQIDHASCPIVVPDNLQASPIFQSSSLEEGLLRLSAVMPHGMLLLQCKQFL
jgi:hypothetical protein